MDELPVTRETPRYQTYLVTCWQGIAWLRIADGKIVSDTAYWDNLVILEQLGAAPTVT